MICSTAPTQGSDLWVLGQTGTCAKPGQGKLENSPATFWISLEWKEVHTHSGPTPTWSGEWGESPGIQSRRWRGEPGGAETEPMGLLQFLHKQALSQESGARGLFGR